MDHCEFLFQAHDKLERDHLFYSIYYTAKTYVYEV